MVASGSSGSGTRKPRWLAKRISCGGTFHEVMGIIMAEGLHTVCQEAHCPNLSECFSRGTATFMILGDVCTRKCTFCAVRHGNPSPPSPEEPHRVADAVRRLGLKFAVITSVTRDDLPDGGAGHFAATIRAIREASPNTGVEVLVPDFKGKEASIRTVAEAGPEVINHNLETVPRLYREVRPGADYNRSLRLLRMVRDLSSGRIVTKSGIMVGLGESREELVEVMEDLLEVRCELLTLGQYLQPSGDHHPVIRYVPPEEFEELKSLALSLGFTGVASGPFVRSSYMAEGLFSQAIGGS